MAETWRDLSEGALRAAESLLREGHYRSCVSRAYYAGYCALTAEIIKVITTFPNGWKNPPHIKVPNYIENNLSMARVRKDRLIDLINALRIVRETADYRPHELVDEVDAKGSIRDAAEIQTNLWGVNSLLPIRKTAP